MSPLSPHIRVSLQSSLTPLVGEEEAIALLSQFPASESERPATRLDLDALANRIEVNRSEQRSELAQIRGEMAELRGEVQTSAAQLRGEMTELRAELRGEMAELRAELRGEMAGLRAELRGEVTELRGEVRGDIAELVAELARMDALWAERLRQQTTWMVGALLAGMTVVGGVAGLIG